MKSTKACLTLLALTCAAGCAAAPPIEPSPSGGVAQPTRLTAPLLAQADPAPSGCDAARIRLATPEPFEHALAALTAQCDEDRGASCLAAGEMQLAGCGTRSSVDAAAGSFELGCELGEHRACGERGILAATRRGPEMASPDVAQYLLYGCDAAHGAACRHLGQLLEHGEQLPKDDAWARKLYDRGCHLGDAEACRLADRHGLATSTHPAGHGVAPRRAKQSCVSAEGVSAGKACDPGDPRTQP